MNSVVHEVGRFNDIVGDYLELWGVPVASSHPLPSSA